MNSPASGGRLWPGCLRVWLCSALVTLCLDMIAASSVFVMIVSTIFHREKVDFPSLWHASCKSGRVRARYVLSGAKRPNTRLYVLSLGAPWRTPQSGSEQTTGLVAIGHGTWACGVVTGPGGPARSREKPEAARGFFVGSIGKKTNG